ncbi:GGDEF domain-containing protein [Pendulispora rubella]|uniref:diguanylate cyclase n=1 Tax=Pendulispora rubella TaxID=2741070 RepID=A0ABZ2L0Z8_9BACT
MPDDDSKGGSRPRKAHLRTKPLVDNNQFREALQAELRKHSRPVLIVVAGPEVGMRLRLDRSVEVGRDPSASLPLRDESVSWRHVRFEDRGAGEWAVVDLSSTNGTLLNSERVSDSRLKPGDRIVLGKTILEFQEQDAIQQGFNAELERMLSEDELSGLWVKRRFDAQLATTVAAVDIGTVDVVSCIVMDLDGVKGINDTHGHDMGAFVIGTSGQVIGRVIAAQGFATRFGGDEFAAALPGVAKDEAVRIADNIREAIRAHVFQRNGITVHPGISLGVASLPGDATDAEGLFRAADQAMYRAKRGGKNRVAI